VCQQYTVGALVGLVAGLGMYAVLAAVSVFSGRGLTYPFAAVHALMSGAHVLPDYPRPTLRSDSVLSPVVGPILFLLPAVVVGLAAVHWARRLHPQSATARIRPLDVVLPVTILAVLSFCAFVLVLGFQVSSPATQRFSSGFGIRQLGLTAWIVGHLAYVAVFSALIAPVDRFATALNTEARISTRPMGVSQVGRLRLDGGGAPGSLVGTRNAMSEEPICVHAIWPSPFRPHPLS
jgi:hypothetical protein